MPKKLPIISIFIALFVMIFALRFAVKLDPENIDFAFWILRILVALATSVISSFIPGMITLNYDKDNTVINRNTEENINFTRLAVKKLKRV